MRSRGEALLVCAVFAFCASCGRQTPGVVHAAAPARVSDPSPPPEVRLSGTVQAVHFLTVQVPEIMGQGGRLTLTWLIANGARVKKGEVLAQFDRTQELDNARDARAKFDDLSHQVDQRKAQNRADAAKRAADLEGAQADLAKAQIELRKGPLLAEIDRLKDEVTAQAAREHVASLKKSDAFHDQSDAAAVRILELQRDRQKVALDRALSNAERLEVRATLDGMVALENVWRNGTMGKAQEGDQLWSGQPLIQVFDPSVMEVNARVGEPDVTALSPGCRATVLLDAYPNLSFQAHMVSASPAASTALGSPIRTFSAIFLLDESDPHLLPDLSAAVILEPPAKSGP